MKFDKLLHRLRASAPARYLTVFRTSFKERLEYPHVIFLALLSFPLHLVIMTFLWSAFVDEPLDKMFTYFLAVNFLSYYGYLWIIAGRYDRFVRGREKLGYVPLTKPVKPFQFYTMVGLGREAVEWLVVVLIVMLVFVCMGHIDYIYRWFIALPLVLLSMIFILSIVYVTTGFSYWVFSTWGIRTFFVGIMFVFNGGSVPLWIIPQELMNLVDITPFPHLIYHPAMFVITNDFTHYTLPLLVLPVWTLLFFGIGMLLHKIGWKRFEALGG